MFARLCKSVALASLARGLNGASPWQSTEKFQNNPQSPELIPGVANLSDATHHLMYIKMISIYKQMIDVLR